MSWLHEIFSGGAEGIFTGVSKVIGTMKADPLEVLRLQQAISQAEMQMATALSQAQNRVNEIEAASTDKFTSRWRPAAGYCGVAGLAYATIVFPLATWVCINLGALPPPQLDTSILMEVVTGMLGLAAMRSYDKSRVNKV